MTKVKWKTSFSRWGDLLERIIIVITITIISIIIIIISRWGDLLERIGSTRTSPFTGESLTVRLAMIALLMTLVASTEMMSKTMPMTNKMTTMKTTKKKSQLSVGNDIQ